MKTPLLLLLGFVFSSCSFCSQCHLTTGRSFDHTKQMSVLVLPVSTYGNPALTTLPNYSDDIATAFLKAGYDVIDRSAAQAQASKLGIDLTKGVEDKDMPSLASALNVDAIMFATVAYAYKPAESGTTPLVMNSTTDSTGKVQKVSVKGPSEYQRPEQYVMTSMSARLVDAKTMQTLLSAYAEPCNGKGVNTWIVNLLEERFSQGN